VTTVELLRHATAASRKSWGGHSDGARPLDEQGYRQAHDLAAALTTGEPIAAVYSSPLTRCVQTCEPLAASTGLPIEVDSRIGEASGIPVADNGSAWVASAWLGGRALGLVDEIIRKHAGARTVVCSHGDVIPSVLAVLVGRDGLDLSDVGLGKGGRVTLSFDGDRCVAARRLEAAKTPTHANG
jgi:broad specificity phosphatase PhoE